MNTNRHLLTFYIAVRYMKNKCEIYNGTWHMILTSVSCNLRHSKPENNTQLYK